MDKKLISELRRDFSENMKSIKHELRVVNNILSETGTNKVFEDRIDPHYLYYPLKEYYSDLHDVYKMLKEFSTYIYHVKSNIVTISDIHGLSSLITTSIRYDNVTETRNLLKALKIGQLLDLKFLVDELERENNDTE